MSVPRSIVSGLRLTAVSLIALFLIVFSSPSTVQGLQTDTDPAPENIIFSKSFSSNTIGPGSVSTLQYTINNLDSVPVQDLAFVDVLPAGMAIATPASAGTTCFDAVITASNGGDTIVFSNGRLGAGQSCTISVNVVGSTIGVLTSTSGDLTSNAGNSGSATADLTVTSDRPGFSKSFSPNNLTIGGTSTLLFTIDNSQNTSDLFVISFSDSFPNGMVVATPANAQTDCSSTTLTATSGSSVVSLSSFFIGRAVLSAGATCTVSVDVTTATAGTFDNITGDLTASTGGASFSAGKASDALTVDFPFLVKEYIDDPVAPGGTVTLEYTITNFDRAEAAANLSFTDNLDTVVSGLVATGLPLSNPCGSGSSLSGTSTLTFTGGSLSPEESCTFQVTLQVPANAPTGTFSNSTSTLSGEFGGRSESKAAASAELIIDAAPVLTKSFTDDPIVAGGSVTVEYSVTNASSSLGISDIAFTDEFDVFLSGITPVGVPASNVCGEGSLFFVQTLNTGQRILVLSGGNLAPSASCTFSVTWQLASDVLPGIYTSPTSDVTATIGESTLQGSGASDDLTIVGGPVLIKAFLNSPVNPGDTVTLRFSLSYDENSPAGGTNIAFSDDLTAALPGLTAIDTPLTDICGEGSSLTGTTNLSFTGGTLAVGEVCSFDVTLQVPGSAIGGTYTNSVDDVTATSLGVAVTGRTAEADLEITGLTEGLNASKGFSSNPTVAGAEVTVVFTLTNASDFEATSIRFSDSLDVFLPGVSIVSTLPVSDVCGTGSSLLAVGTILVFTGGSLASGASCTISVTIQVPSTTVPNDYTNNTSTTQATVGGENVFLDPMVARLEIVEPFGFSKTFTDDPVAAGETVTLEFAINNNTNEIASSVAFTDDLEAVLPGLTAADLPLNDVCGEGSQVSGTSVIALSNGFLEPGQTCTFAVTLQMPSTVEVESAVNTTSALTGFIGATAVTGATATDILEITSFNLSLSKAFAQSVKAGDSVTLSFTIENQSLSEDIVGPLRFSDNLDNVIPGLVAVGLPITDVCGEGSLATGTSLIAVTDVFLAGGETCTFAVTVQVPLGVEPGDYVNTTTDLFIEDLSVTGAAVATLTILPGDSPVAGDDAAVTDVGTAVTVNVLGNDSDNDSEVLTVTGVNVSGEAGVAVVNEDNTVTFTPAEGVIGRVTLSYTVEDDTGLTDTGTVTVLVTETILVNFQAPGSATPAGYLADGGAAYGLQANGRTYGWVNPATGQPADNSANTRDRDWFNIPPDQRYDTFAHTQLNGDFSWELEVSSGWYQVTLVAGDPQFASGVYSFDVEGQSTVDDAPTVGQYWLAGTSIVQVTDGRLTVSNSEGSTGNNKAAFIHVVALGNTAPSGFAANINYQLAGATTPAGYEADTGELFGDRGNGFSYGWDVDSTAQARDRDWFTSLDQRYDTLMHMQLGGERSWEVAVPNGVYAVRLIHGDGQYYIDHVYRTDVEGTVATDGSGAPANRLRFMETTVIVAVNDGLLTLSNADGADRNKINFIEISQIGG